MNTGRLKKLVLIILTGAFLAGSSAFAAQKCPKGQRWDKKTSQCMVMKHHQKKAVKKTNKTHTKKVKKKAEAPAGQ